MIHIKITLSEADSDGVHHPSPIKSRRWRISYRPLVVKSVKIQLLYKSCTSTNFWFSWAYEGNLLLPVITLELTVFCSYQKLLLITPGSELIHSLLTSKQITPFSIYSCTHVYMQQQSTTSFYGLGSDNKCYI